MAAVEGFLTLENQPHAEYVSKGYFRTVRNSKRVIVTKTGLAMIKKRVALSEMTA